MLYLVFGKKKLNRGSKQILQESNISMSIWGMQDALLTSAALTTEVGTLKQNLERSENELGHAKRKLEETEGKKYLIEICERCNCKK